MQSNRKVEPKVLVFPSDSSNKSRPPLQLVMPGTILGKGQFGLVHLAYERDDPTNVFAVKVIERSKVRE